MAFDLKNKAKGVQEFPDFVATVFSDGTVRWSRMGFVEAMCTFVGLRMMPFDQLGCQLHFTGGQQRLKLNLMERESATGGIDRGFGIGDYQQSYTEHKLIPENLKCDYYLGDPYETGDLHVDIFFERSSRHYIMFTIFPNILFVILSLDNSF